MKPYKDRVFDIMESFSIFDGSVIECAKGIFVDSQIDSMYPTNAAVCCLNIANQRLHGSDLRPYWSDILKVFHTSPVRKRKPTLGRKLFQNIILKSENIEGSIDMDKHIRITEVMFSGSEIQKGLLPEAEDQGSSQIHNVSHPQ